VLPEIRALLESLQPPPQPQELPSQFQLEPTQLPSQTPLPPVEPDTPQVPPEEDTTITIITNRSVIDTENETPQPEQQQPATPPLPGPQPQPQPQPRELSEADLTEKYREVFDLFLMAEFERYICKGNEPCLWDSIFFDLFTNRLDALQYAMECQKQQIAADLLPVTPANELSMKIPGHIKRYDAKLMPLVKEHLQVHIVHDDHNN
jgi:hypothetical protein